MGEVVHLDDYREVTARDALEYAIAQVVVREHADCGEMIDFVLATLWHQGFYVAPLPRQPDDVA